MQIGNGKIDNPLSNYKKRTDANSATPVTIKEHASQTQIGLDDFVQVIDNKTNEIIFQGAIVYEKSRISSEHGTGLRELAENEKLYSLDNKYFFKVDDSNYTVKKLDSGFVNNDFIEHNYQICDWNKFDYSKRENVNIYKENTILELDKEVIPIVAALNKFSPDLYTTGSCSGHDKEPAWVSVTILNSRALFDLLSCFEPYKRYIDVTTRANVTNPRKNNGDHPYFPSDIAMVLRTKEIGKPAYEIFDKLADYLNRIVDLKYRTDEIMNEVIVQEAMALRTHWTK